MNIRNNFTARNFAVAFLAFFIFASNVFGQNPTPTPESDLIRVNTDLIQTNITVLDKNKRFVDGLKAERFDFRFGSLARFVGKSSTDNEPNSRTQTYLFCFRRLLPRLEK